MKIALTYNEARDLIRQASQDRRNHLNQAAVAIDIGKQFGTRILMHLSEEHGIKLLNELEMRDLPLPQVMYFNRRVLIGVDPK
jgi:hypothetical protein